MRWIGSLYITNRPTCLRLFEEAHRLVYSSNIAKDGFLVQAMLLLIIGLDGSRRREKVNKLLADIERISQQIGLNTRSFAALNGRGMAILEESWRRTWWDLYVVDAMIAGVHRTTNFLLYDVPVNVALPCEEDQFLSGHIPQPLCLEDMEICELLNAGQEFSSFAYRIQCARNLGKFLRLPILGLKCGNMAKIQALLANWESHLPMSKRMVYRDGRLDEMMFQAYMMAHALSILLHQPYSQLDPSPTRYINACAPNTPALSTHDFNPHTKRTIHAACEISKLITHRVPLRSHTHFFFYMVTLASTVQLSEWTLAFVAHNNDMLRQQVRLSIGALDEFSKVWPAASHLSSQVKAIAKEVYRIKREQQRIAPPEGILDMFGSSFYLSVS
ncbi:hypothetical protein BGZ63DRAFT_454775 [Mariannaea sp. PMI_226]|nr:hypothetical protein BGZ63DRAFT_454775 [Mariannaea sp. PMI_226]